MKHLFLPYELAVIAKEKGFDERSIAHWYIWAKKPNLYINDHYANGQNQIRDGRKIDCLAPIYQQIIDWFREKHKIHITVGINHYGKYWYEIIVYCKHPYPAYRIETEKGGFRLYDIARGRAIEEAFKLIQI